MKNYKDIIKALPPKTVVIAQSCFNPPSKVHELLVKVVKKVADKNKAHHFIFVDSVNDKKNPLEYTKKLSYLKLFFPNTFFKEQDGDIKSIINSLHNKYKRVILVTEDPKMKDGYGLKVIKFDGHTCNKAALKAAKQGDYETFKESLPTSAREIDGKRLMNDVRIGLGKEPIKEQINLVKDSLRESYFRGEIFNENDIVECSDTLYKVIKRGSNHLLLQNEEGEKVSKWIHEVNVTQRTFMENKIEDVNLVEADASMAAAAKSEQEKAKKASEMARLQAQHAQKREQLAQQQAREKAILATNVKRQNEEAESPVVNTKSKYNIAKSVMNFKDFKRMVDTNPVNTQDEVKMTDSQKKMTGAGNKNTDSDFDAENQGNKNEVGGQYDRKEDEQLRRMKDEYQAESHIPTEKASGVTSGVNDKHEEDWQDKDAQPANKNKEKPTKNKRFQDMAKALKWDRKEHPNVKEETVTSTKDINGPVAKPKETGTVNKVANSRYGSPVGSKSSVPAKKVELSKEEVELDEVSSATLKSYIKKSKEQGDKASDEGDHDKAFKRTMGRMTATGKLIGKTADSIVKNMSEAMSDERKEQLKKAAEKLRELPGVRDAQNMEKKLQHDINTAWTNAEKRNGKGNAFGHRPVKEEVEQIDELGPVLGMAARMAAGAVTAAAAGKIGSMAADKLQARKEKQEKALAPVKKELNIPASSNTDTSTGTVNVGEELEYGEFTEEDIRELENQLDEWTDDEMFDALWEDEECYVLDEETGEAYEIEKDDETLMEVMGRRERVMARARLRRSQHKRQIKHRVALKHIGSASQTNKRAQRMAISQIKKRLLGGRNPYKVSVGEKERVERFIKQRREIVNRLSSRMASRVKKVERSRFHVHRKYSKANDGRSF